MMIGRGISEPMELLGVYQIEGANKSRKVRTDAVALVAVESLQDR